MKPTHLHFFRTFWVATLITLLTISIIFWKLGPGAAMIATLLIVLEITFSFENAVINARVLAHMSKFWQEIFMTIGIAVAVFGMRIVFPIALVAVTSGQSVMKVLDDALNRPEIYSQNLETSTPTIAAFGGMFLAMVFLSYFIFENKKDHWIKSVERAFRSLPKHWITAPLICFLVLVSVVALFKPQSFSTLVTAGMIGIALQAAMHAVISYMQSRKLANSAVKLTGVGGFTAFLYLEFLDASFSLDGVIGAFAITSSVVLIAAGLGAGAVWVRSMTLYLVRHETLARYVHLEQGAHYAIGLLAVVLLLMPVVHVPEVVTGLMGVSVIIASIVMSRVKRSKLASESIQG